MPHVGNHGSKRCHSLRHVFGPLTRIAAGLEDLARTSVNWRRLERKQPRVPSGPIPNRIRSSFLHATVPSLQLPSPSPGIPHYRLPSVRSPVGNLNFWRLLVATHGTPKWNFHCRDDDTGTWGISPSNDLVLVSFSPFHRGLSPFSKNIKPTVSIFITFLRFLLH